MPVYKQDRCSSYVCTLDLNSTEDQEFLKVLRLSVRARNLLTKKLRESTPNLKRWQLKRERVSLYGRIGKNNPAAEKYKRSNPWYPNKPNYARIRLADAAHVDVYIQKVYND